MKAMSKIWKTLRKPLHRALKGHEPAVVKTATGAALLVAAHYGLHLNAADQTWVTVGVTGLVGWAIRESVTPNATLALSAPAPRRRGGRAAGTVRDTSTYPASVAQRTPDIR